MEATSDPTYGRRHRSLWPHPGYLRPLMFIIGSARLPAPLRFPSPHAAATPPPSSGPLAFTLGAPIRTQGMCLPPCRRMTQHHPKKRRPKDYCPGGYGGKSPPPCDRPIPSWGYLSAYRHSGGYDKGRYLEDQSGECSSMYPRLQAVTTPMG